MVESVRVSYYDWRHGLVTCPSCGLQLDSEKDLKTCVYGDRGRRPTGAHMTHRRCGASCWIEFED